MKINYIEKELTLHEVFLLIKNGKIKLKTINLHECSYSFYSKAIERIFLGISKEIFYMVSYNNPCHEKDYYDVFLDSDFLFFNLIFWYMSNSFPLIGLRKLSQLESKYFNELDPKIRYEFETKIIKIRTIDFDDPDLTLLIRNV